MYSTNTAREWNRSSAIGAEAGGSASDTSHAGGTSEQESPRTKTGHLRRRPLHVKRAVLAAAMAALVAGGTLACGEDGEQTSPLAPSAIETPSPQAQPASTAGDSPSGSPGRNIGQESVGTQETSSTTATSNHGELTVVGDLPPGVTMSDLQERARLRNAQSERELQALQGGNGGGVIQNADHPSRPGRVRITSTSVEYRDDRYYVSLRFALPSVQPDKIVIEAERPVGNRRGKDEIAGTETGWERFWISSHSFSPGWYVFWVAGKNCNGNQCRTGSWSVAIVEVEDMSPPDPEPAPAPGTIRWKRGSGNWSCMATYCQVRSGYVRISRAVDDAIAQVQVRPQGQQAWTQTISNPIENGREVDLAYALRQGKWEMRARQRDETIDPWSEWSRISTVDVQPSASQAQAEGSQPGEPRNVIVQRVEGGGNRWKVSWDPPNSGGWAITEYRLGDTGPDISDGAPGRSCGDSSWPWVPFNPDDPPPSAGSGDEGREYGLGMRVYLPGGWTISISAVSIRGEGACAAGQR